MWLRKKNIYAVIPDLFQEVSGGSASRLPVLNKWLSKSHATPVSGGCYDQIMQFMGYESSLWSFAGLRADWDELDPEQCWICADPLQLALDWVHVYAVGPADGFWLAEVQQQFIESINAQLPQSYELVAADGLRWYLKLPQSVDFLSKAPVDIFGHTIVDCMPDGKDGASLRQLFNEIQMLLYAHPLNSRRREAGLSTLDALWFWGAGSRIRSLSSPKVQLVCSEDPVVLALASCNDLQHQHDLDTSSSNNVLWANFEAKPHDISKTLAKKLSRLYVGDGFCYDSE